MTLPAQGGAALRKLRLDADLRDVIVVLTPTGYYQAAACDGAILHGAVSILPPTSAAPRDGAALPTPALWQIALPVDIAVAPDGKRAAVVGAGSYTTELIDLDNVTSEGASGTCGS